MKTIAKLHQMLDIIYSWEVEIDQIEESCLCIRQILACQEFKQVPEIISAMESDPMHTIIQHNPI